MRTTCCVPHCDSKRSSIKIHRFPQSDTGLRKWVKSINCALLKELKPKELRKLFVCHKHFEKQFVTGSLRLRQLSYPTLFTNKELDTGKPDELHRNIHLLNKEVETTKKGHEDHTYNKPIQNIQQSENQFESYEVPSISMETNLDCQVPATSTITEYIGYDLPSILIVDPDFYYQMPSTSTIMKNSDVVLHIDVVETPNEISNGRVEETTPILNKILYEYRKAQKQINFTIRANRAVNFTEKENFEKIITEFNELEKNKILMHINQSTKKKSRRFTDEEKIVALAVMNQFPRSYEFLRRIFILPSSRILNEMIYMLNVESGILPHIFEAIKTEVENWPERRKYCSVIFDLISLKSGLIFDKHNDICGSGLVDLYTNTKNCDHALTFMVRGAIYKWQQPLCFYLCEVAKNKQNLKNILCDVVKEVIKTGLLPVALICDQGAAFQSVLKELQEDTRQQQILTEIPTDDTVDIHGCNLSIILDPPQLLKGIRNNFLYKHIKCNGKISKWSDIVDVYTVDCKQPEVRLLKKLKDEHVIPQKIKKKEVKNCFKVFSKTVASALAYTSQFSEYADGPKVSETILNTSETVAFFDNLFDSCNGVSVTLKDRSKPLRQAVTTKSKHSKFWQNAILVLKQMRFVDINGKECLVPSQINFITTLKSLLRLSENFQKYGLNILRPHYFNCDPIVNFFGQMRAYSSYK